MTQIGVYILNGKRYYVGSTNDLKHRLEQHHRGHTHTTKRIGSWELVKFFPFPTIEEAKAFERQIKRSKNIRRWIRKTTLTDH